MRLLQIRGCDELSLVQRLPDDLPPYAILSHTWGPSNEEVTYQDLLDGKGTEKVGYRKLVLCGRQAVQDGFQYFWVDTCCIDKTSSAELSEAINSMYSWYQSAGVCYAYLADIGPEDSFPTSKWFTRGWTLQELLAPEEVIFFDKNWTLLGTRAGLGEEISERTRISVSVLSQAEPVETFSVAQRMSWAAERKTTRIEDIAYCLLGIFNINMPLIYGEGENAFIRLQEEILKISDDHSIFAWRSTDDRGGCLATSPASFRKSGKIVQCLTLDKSYDPVILSGKGVHLNVRFMGIGHDKLGCAKLDCHEEGSGDKRISIYLRDTSLTMRHLRRVKTEEFAQTDFGDFVSSRYPVRRLCIQKSRVESRRKGRLYGEPMGIASITVASGQLSQEEKMAESPKSLLEAVKIGTEDGVWLLLTRGDIEVNEEDQDNLTALTYAARNGKENIVKMLLNHTDVDISPRDLQERTPLWWATSYGHNAVVRLLLETSKAKVNLADKNDSTPLSIAVKSGDLAMAQLLLKVHGIDVNAKDRNRLTPLLWAIKSALKLAVEKDRRRKLDKTIAIIRLLLEVGKANPNIRDGDERTSFSYLAAAKDERMEPIRTLLVREMVLYESSSLDQNSNTPLLGAVLSSELEVIELLLETRKVNVNFRNIDGLSPLLAAIFKTQNVAVTKLLLKTPQIDINVRDKDGRTPISRLANYASSTRSNMAKLLLNTPGIAINSRDLKGRTPIIWAIISGSSNMVAMLLRTPGVEVNAQDDNGRTPISWAAASSNIELVEKLLGSSHVNINLQDKNGRTPLSWAAETGNIAVVKVLLELSHVNINLQDDNGRTPLLWAVRTGDITVVKRLLGVSHVDVNLQDNNGRSALSWAAAAGNSEMVKALLQIPNVDVGLRDNYGETPFSRVRGINGHVVRTILAKRMRKQGLTVL